MADLSSTHHTALQALIMQHADGTRVPYPGVATCFIRRALGDAAWTARETRNLMHRFRQTGLVEPAPHGLSLAGGVLYWRITDAGVAALGLEDAAHG